MSLPIRGQKVIHELNLTHYYPFPTQSTPSTKVYKYSPAPLARVHFPEERKEKITAAAEMVTPPPILRPPVFVAVLAIAALTSAAVLPVGSICF